VHQLLRDFGTPDKKLNRKIPAMVKRAACRRADQLAVST
jgi:hypothetical protein